MRAAQTRVWATSAARRYADKLRQVLAHTPRAVSNSVGLSWTLSDVPKTKTRETQKLRLAGLVRTCLLAHCAIECVLAPGLAKHGLSHVIFDDCPAVARHPALVCKGGNQGELDCPAYNGTYWTAAGHRELADHRGNMRINCNMKLLCLPFCRRSFWRTPSRILKCADCFLIRATPLCVSVFYLLHRTKKASRGRLEPCHPAARPGGIILNWR